MIGPLYAGLATALTPLLRLWLNRRMRRGKEDPARVSERFGYASHPRPSGSVIWVHAASVGEMSSVLTLIHQLLAAEPSCSVLLTTGTVTSATLAAAHCSPRLIHQFIPLDTPACVQRFLDHWKPTLACWVESELWPTLLLASQKRAIPLFLINARMSEKSARNWHRFPHLIQDLLGCFCRIYAGSLEDAARLRLLTPQPILEAGNLKYDADALPRDAQLIALLTQGIAARPFWIAASTHPGEEMMMVTAHEQLRHKLPNTLCILIPRHPIRGDEIAQMLRDRGLPFAQRSKGDRITPSISYYLADTMGELGSFYQLATIVFLGGSLVPVGGHNPLEPARLHCALLTGPHTHNFASMMTQFETAQALIRVENAAQLTHHLAQLLTHPQQVEDRATRARQVVESAQGATAIILADLLQQLGSGASHAHT